MVATVDAGPNQHEGNVRMIEEWCTENAVELILWNPLDEGSDGEATGGMSLQCAQ
jgi:hypothetical protein